MKKVISVLLAVLMIFSVFGATVAFAEDELKETYTIIFVDFDGTELAKFENVTKGDKVIAPAYPVRENTPDMKYVFKGWKKGDDETVLYHQNTIPEASGSEEVITYTAVYSEQPVEETLTFFGLIAYIFSQFNRIFETIASWFGIN